MKTAWYSLLLALTASAGCVGLPKLPETPAPAAAAPPPAVKPARPTARVSADRVTEANAREAAHQLADELDRDAEAGAPAPTTKDQP